MAFIGIILIIVGLTQLFAPDFSWEMTELSHERQGLESKRTPSWEMSNAIGGAIILITGIGLLIGAAAG